MIKLYKGVKSGKICSFSEELGAGPSLPTHDQRRSSLVWIFRAPRGPRAWGLLSGLGRGRDSQSGRLNARGQELSVLS